MFICKQYSSIHMHAGDVSLTSKQHVYLPIVLKGMYCICVTWAASLNSLMCKELTIQTFSLSLVLFLLLYFSPLIKNFKVQSLENHFRSPLKSPWYVGMYSHVSEATPTNTQEKCLCSEGGENSICSARVKIWHCPFAINCREELGVSIFVL